MPYQTTDAHNWGVKIGSEPELKAFSHVPVVFFSGFVFVFRAIVLDRDPELFMKSDDESFLIGLTGVEISPGTGPSAKRRIRGEKEGERGRRRKG
jgi:hypothetical protein